MTDTNGNLDRKRSFGVVYGHSGIGFMQDNKPFRHDGTPYVDSGVTSSSVPAETFPGVPRVDDIPTVEQVQGRPLTHSEKMKQVWAARRAAEADATIQR